ncbi:MAG: SBBP repeat-containing protein [Deltaproteobacteria bacterium]|nr:SBBP repeat-containing protein [Deltaproteobacteria bacterium]
MRYRYLIKSGCFFLLLGLMVGGEAFAALKEKTKAPHELLQLTAGRHVLGFGDGKMVVAGADHSLRVSFSGARHVAPISPRAGNHATRHRREAQPLNTVTYSNLWEGVTLVCDRLPGSILKSTYYIAPRPIQSAVANPVDPIEQIRLCYNVPVKLDRSGNLLLNFKAGQLRESAPVAWQEIGGERIPVEARFHIRGEKEVGFRVGRYDPVFPLIIDPVLTWHTFMGSAGGDDDGYGIAFDGSGNVYVAGKSAAAWGSPINAFAGNFDVYVTKLDRNGNRLWHTFMGSAGDDDYGYGIAFDGSGNVYVTGKSKATWGTPVNGFTTGPDIFAAKLDRNGNRIWNTFLGLASEGDYGSGIAVDGSGNVFVASPSGGTWGTPVNAFAGQYDVFAAKLDRNGNHIWHTYMGSAGMDAAEGADITVDNSGNIYVTGGSNATWGTPVNAFAGDYDAFVARLDRDGNRIWNTFMGSAAWDYGYGIALDNSGNVYVAGDSEATWGTPINALAGGYDVFAAKLDSDGNRIWHTFMGSTGDDLQAYTAIDSAGNVYVTGLSPATWGTPVNAHSGGEDIFVARLDGNGNRIWHTFRGSAGDDQPYRIAVDNSGNVCVAGKSDAAWGTPVNAFAGGNDAFAVRFADVSVTSTNSTISDVTVAFAIAGEPASFSTQHVIGFTATGVNESADISINYACLPDPPVFYKEVNGTLKIIYPVNRNTGITNVSLDNHALRFTIEDNSDCDTDTTIGTIKDPVVSGSYPAPGGGSDGGCFISTMVCE